MIVLKKFWADIHQNKIWFFSMRKMMVIARVSFRAIMFEYT